MASPAPALSEPRLTGEAARLFDEDPDPLSPLPFPSYWITSPDGAPQPPKGGSPFDDDIMAPGLWAGVV